MKKHDQQRQRMENELKRNNSREVTPKKTRSKGIDRGMSL